MLSVCKERNNVVISLLALAQKETSKQSLSGLTNPDIKTVFEPELEQTEIQVEKTKILFQVHGFIHLRTKARKRVEHRK